MNTRFIKRSITSGVNSFWKIFRRSQIAKQQSKKEASLERENQKLKTMVGELTMERQKKRLVKIRRRRCAAVEESDRLILPIIRQLKAEHPFWIYRRIWDCLSFIERVLINKKRVYRLLLENGLLFKGDEKLKAKRISRQSKPRPVAPNSW